MLKRILLSLTLSTSAFSAENTSDFKDLPFDVPSNIQALLKMNKNDLKAFSSLELEEAYEATSSLKISEKLSTRLLFEEQEMEHLKAGKKLYLSNINQYLEDVKKYEELKKKRENEETEYLGTDSYANFLPLKDQALQMLKFSYEQLAKNRSALSEAETKLQKLEASIAPIVHFKQRLEELLKLMEDIDSATTG